MTYLVLAYYIFTPIENPGEEIKKHKDFFKEKDVSGRIYISEQGINGQMSGVENDAKGYIEWLHSDLRFKDVKFKIHTYHENVFPRMTVKYRQQIVALDKDIDPSQGGEHVSPKKWREMLENDEKYLILDVRNDYEGVVGHFKGAVVPDRSIFRDFPAYVQELKKKYTPENTKVMMYCTGGIRCELFSVVMKEEGFQEVSQLDGGVIKYGLEEGNTHWDGKLFVFDDRLTIPISDDHAEPISFCSHCDSKVDTYYNCANMDCNKLFIACLNCTKEHKGCCQTECQTAPRVRRVEEQISSKPFRRWHLLDK